MPKAAEIPIFRISVVQNHLWLLPVWSEQHFYHRFIFRNMSKCHLFLLFSVSLNINGISHQSSESYDRMLYSTKRSRAESKYEDMMIQSKYKSSLRFKSRFNRSIYLSQFLEVSYLLTNEVVIFVFRCACVFSGRFNARTHV